MVIAREWTIRCDDDTEHGTCPYVSGTDIDTVRLTAETTGWTSNGRNDSHEQWHCPNSNKRWCAEACGNLAVSATYCGPCLDDITSG